MILSCLTTVIECNGCSDAEQCAAQVTSAEIQHIQEFLDNAKLHRMPRKVFLDRFLHRIQTKEYSQS